MKKYKWNDVKVMLGGVELKGVTSVSIPFTVAELQSKLKENELIENYELCAEIKKEIDKLSNS